MKTNGMGKRILIFTLIAVIVLTMQGSRVFAESLRPESLTKTSAGQLENQPETTGEETVSQNDLPKKESVSGNDLAVLQSEDQPVVAEQSDAATEFQKILAECIVPGIDPPGVTINLFDYWQAVKEDGGPDPTLEIDHDQPVPWDQSRDFITYKLGISKGHLLRFGYTSMWYDAEKGKFEGCGTCIENGYFGAWNDSIRSGICQGIVQNKLGPYGDPVLNLDTKLDADFEGYTEIVDDKEREAYLSKKNESLAYLFSPSVPLPDYKASYIDARGLFQQDEDGYYYYSSTKNFASYNKAKESFILYNSPGVAQKVNDIAIYCGQFFPFNTAEEVFDTYTTDDNKNYHLSYEGNESIRSDDGNGYLNCSARKLNHYLGMTMEFLFQQPENGRLSNKKPMTFEFSGDDDVWIFIDNVLVADLGGLHGACSLDIDFSTGMVNVKKEDHTLLENHTLLKSFKDVYGEDSKLGGIAFRGNTFADNTDHTLKMFYLERGHGASDLDLRFNIQTVAYDPVKEEPPNVPNEDSGETDGAVETEEPAPDQAPENTSESAESIVSRSDDHMTLNTTGMPRTGDDSRIGWLIALCIISLSGIGVAVYNLIFVRRKRKSIH